MAKITKKEERLLIFNKCNGHCAYCGQEIKLDGFEVDHVEAIRRTDTWGGSDEIENKLPACRQCNRSKGTFTPEEWKRQLQYKIKMLNRDSSTYRVAKRFGLVKETGIEIHFYYERF